MIVRSISVFLQQRSPLGTNVARKRVFAAEAA